MIENPKFFICLYIKLLCYQPMNISDLIIGQTRKHKRWESKKSEKEKNCTSDNLDGEKKTIGQRQNRGLDSRIDSNTKIIRNSKTKLNLKRMKTNRKCKSKYILATKMVNCNLNVGICEKSKEFYLTR